MPSIIADSLPVWMKGDEDVNEEKKHHTVEQFSTICIGMARADRGEGRRHLPERERGEERYPPRNFFHHLFQFAHVQYIDRVRNPDEYPDFRMAHYDTYTGVAYDE